MNILATALQDYLRVRRSLGFKLTRAGRLLEDFVGFCEKQGADRVTSDLALAWATSPGGDLSWAAERLGMVRGFASWLQSIDPATEIPPVGLLPRRPSRATPYLYSHSDIAALMAAARRLRNPLRAATYETLIGLLATTGIRVGEAIRLDRADV